MSRIALHFPKRAKAILYGNLLLSLLSGVAWFALHRWGQLEGEFGQEPNPAEPWLLKLHGASAFLALIGFGYILASHVPVGLRSKRNKPLGLMLIGGIGLLAMTGYLLYYVADEAFRGAVSWTHLGLGLCLPIVLILHIFNKSGKKRH